MHAVLLDGEALDPMHRIALLRSESHTHARYEAARRALLGLPSEDDPISAPGAEGERDA